MQGMRVVTLLAFVAATAATPASAGAQRTDRDSATALLSLGLRREAVPLLERLVANGTADRAIYERLAFLLLEGSASIPDAAGRKQVRVRARGYFSKAIELGSDDLQVRSMFERLPPDGGDDAVFSGDKAVDETMKTAEAAFGSGKFRDALNGYQRALALDPALYEAALFSADAYLELKILDSAYLWYDRATQLNPYKETGWRYWSDVLLKHKEFDAARDKAIEAIVAEPFVTVSQHALVAWAEQQRGPIAAPRVDFPRAAPAGARSAARVAYDSVRLAWRSSATTPGAEFTARYPKEAAYRHSLAEELVALRAAARAGGDDAATINLKRLDDVGMLEPYIFFMRADAGIAAEYDAWRREHADVLKRFWKECVIGAKFAK